MQTHIQDVFIFDNNEMDHFKNSLLEELEDLELAFDPPDMKLIMKLDSSSDPNDLEMRDKLLLVALVLGGISRIKILMENSILNKKPNLRIIQKDDDSGNSEIITTIDPSSN